MGLRSAADVLEEYNTVRAAYLKAVDNQQYSIGSGSSNRMKINQNIDSLYNQMLKLSSEYAKLSGTTGIAMKFITPTG